MVTLVGRKSNRGSVQKQRKKPLRDARLDPLCGMRPIPVEFVVNGETIPSRPRTVDDLQLLADMGDVDARSLLEVAARAELRRRRAQMKGSE